MSNPITAQALQRVVIILNSPNDWDEWLEIVKTKAKAGDIWEYANPEKATIPALAEPDFPKPIDVNPDKATIAALTADKKKELQALCQQYKKQFKQFKQHKAVLEILQIHIQETISQSYLPYTFKCKTSHEMILALKQQIVPTDQTQKTELQNQYQKLLKIFKIQNLNNYLQE